MATLGLDRLLQSASESAVSGRSEVMLLVSAHAVATAPLHIVLVDQDAGVIERLQCRFSVTVASTLEAAIEQLERTAPQVLVVELVLANGDGVEVCHAARSSRHRPHVLVTTSAADRVPAALRAGCDSVLVKPFEPTLLFTRIGRLLSSERGLNRFWPSWPCPSCHHDGVVSFDYTEHRRMWCACLACNHVWIAARRE